MCTVQDEDSIIPEKKVEKLINGERRPCMKCGEPASVIIRVNDAFCRACFLTYCTHKFRSAFGKSKLIRDGEKVLVAFSGGQGSTAMMHLIREGLSERAQKKLRFMPSFVYIDEGVVLDQTLEERSQTCQQVAALLQQSGFPWNIITLEKAMQLNSSLEDVTLSENFETLSVSEKEQEEVRKLFRTMKTLSAKGELLRTLRTRLLVSMAVTGGYSKVLMADTGTKLSVRLLSDVAQGRGMHLPLETGFADCRYTGIKLVRPVRDFSAKEVAMYNVFNNLQPLVLPELTTKASSNASIERLTETFVTGLQADFPSTVSTIFRTGEKLSAGDMGEDDLDRCQLCQAPLDTNVPASSALCPTLFSQSLSQKTSNPTIGGASNCDKTDSCCGEGDGSCQSQKDNRLTKEDLNEVLCYGCRLVIKDMSSLDLLPASILQSAAAVIRRKKMKGEIQDFLLPS